MDIKYKVTTEDGKGEQWEFELTDDLLTQVVEQVSSLPQEVGLFFEAVFKQLKNVKLYGLIERHYWSYRISVRVTCFGIHNPKSFDNEFDRYTVIVTAPQFDEIGLWDWKLIALDIAIQIERELSHQLFINREYKDSLHNEIYNNYGK